MALLAYGLLDRLCIFFFSGIAICIENFAILGSHLSVPLRWSCASIVREVSPMQGNGSSKEEKLDFTLIDDHGAWIQCCAMGICANINVIAAGNRIVGFFGTACLDDAKVFFLETDSTVVKVGEVKTIPCKKTFIELVGQPWRRTIKPRFGWRVHY